MKKIFTLLVTVFCYNVDAQCIASFSTNPSPPVGNIPFTVNFINQSVGATTYQWSFGDGHTSIAVNPSNTYTAVGTYTIYLAAANGTSTDTIREIILTQVTGVEEFVNNNNQINIYPNPTSTNFTIETTYTDKQTLQLFDVNGKLVLTQIINGKTNIDASTLNEGVYNISITNTIGFANKRLVIVR